MKTLLRPALWIFVLGLILTTGTTAAQTPPPEAAPTSLTGVSLASTFTYQGALEENGTPANGDYDFFLTLWDGGSAAADYIDNLIIIGGSSAIAVEDGYFSFHLIPETLDMQEAFNGDERWIQVQVRPTGAGDYTTLPRQPITGVPYAWSMRPGATIAGTVAGSSTLRVVNNYSAGSIGSAVFAESHADFAPTVYGVHAGNGNAVYGLSDSNEATVEGVNGGSGEGLSGYSRSGEGVHGYTGSADSSGVVGLQTGYTANDIGIYFNPGGLFGGKNGVAGITKADYGFGVFGWDKSASGGWAGYFLSEDGAGVYASVPDGHVGLNTNGTKPAVVSTDDGARLLYTEESAEVWFTDYGFGELVGGEAPVAIDATFAQTVNLDEPYHVFVEAYGPASLYVTDRTPTGFIVHAREGEPDVEFSYRLVARRLGYEGQRLERAPWADNDPNVNPQATGISRMQGGNGGQP